MMNSLLPAENNNTTCVFNTEVSRDDLLTAINNGNKEIIYKGRNEIIRITFNNCDIVVKQFGKSVKNGIVYSFRKSKAKKSFENALTLLERGILTPRPLMWSERRSRSNYLLESCYICDYVETLSLCEAIDIYNEICIVAFAEFVASLHEKGILHHDLNNTNVRVKVDSQDRLTFSLIDLNRMTFYESGDKIPIKKRFANICKFSSFDDSFVLFAENYIRFAQIAPGLTKDLFKIKSDHDHAVDRKKKFKSIIKGQEIRNSSKKPQ